MNAEKAYLLDTFVVGRQYYAADDVWHSLHIGTRLKMQWESENEHDTFAVTVTFESGGRVYKLGYLPRMHNELIALMLAMGWEDAFECVVSRLNEAAEYDRQIGITVKVLRRVEK